MFAMLRPDYDHRAVKIAATFKIIDSCNRLIRRPKGPFIATQVNSTQLDVELS